MSGAPVRQESSNSTVGSVGKPRSRAGSQSSVTFEGQGRRRSSSSRRNSRDRKMRGAPAKGARNTAPNQPPVVVDEFNNVVTPKPLSKSVNPLSTGATPLDEHLMKEFTMPTNVPSPRANTPMSDIGSDAGWGDPPGDRAKRSKSQSGRSTPSTSSDVGELAPATPANIDIASTIAEEPTPGKQAVGTISEDDAASPTASAAAAARKAKKPSSPRAQASLTKEQLEMHVTTTLSETSTFFLLDIKGTCVALDSEEAAEVTEENTKYDELLELKMGSDSYVNASVQTLPSFPKNKEVLVLPPSTAESGTMATNWDIYDAFNPAEAGTDADGVAVAAAPKAKVSLVMPEPETVPEPEPEPAAAGAEGAGAAAEPEAEAEAEAEPEPEPEPVLPDVSFLGPSLPERLKTVERMLSQNVFHDKHLEYRNYRSAQAIAAEQAELAAAAAAAAEAADGAAEAAAADDGAPRLQKLWTFECEQTDGRNVSAMSWNKEDSDLVAACYGEFDFSVEQHDGCIALWSLKNPTHPERVYSLSCGVTSIDWSSYYPFLLAVGLYDGNVAIYDVRQQDNDEPILMSGNNTSEKHHDPVWQVTWVDKGLERGECLVSISTDGRVKEWRIKKGLEHMELMQMKESSRPDKDQAGGGAAGEQNLVTHFASGMCFDFSPLDPQQYLAGTESGNIHKCSCSYNESYLQDFTGHEPGMPVYKIRWSPFAPNIFLSCSEDWTVKLWKDDATGSTAPSKPLLSFTSSNDYVGDIRWAPTYSTVFGSVTGDGKLDIWDVEREILNPVISHPSGHTRLSTLLFAERSPVVITGADDGQIDVYRLINLEGGSLTDIEQMTNLEQAIQKNLE